MGIALPTWVVESHNNVYVLGLYALVFGVGLPVLVARWWYGSRSKTKDQVYNATAARFFQHLREDTPAPYLLSLLAISDEFKDEKLDVKTAIASAKGKPVVGGKPLDDLERAVREKLGKIDAGGALPPAFRSASTRKTLVLLYAYLLRVDSPDSQLNREKFLTASRSLPLISSITSISLGHSWLEETMRVFTLQQHIVQAIPLQVSRPVAELLQLPHMNIQLADKIIRGSNGKGEFGIQGFAAMTEGERKSVLGVGKNLSDSQYAEMVKVAEEWPRLELLDAYFKVAGERLVTTGAIVQFVVKLRLLPPRKDKTVLRDGVRADKDSSKNVGQSHVEADTRKETTATSPAAGLAEEETDGGKQPLGFARAPYLPDERKPHWWVMLGDYKSDRIIVAPMPVTDIGPDQVRSFSVQFQAPPQAGLYTFHAVIRSDCYLGSDAKQYVRMQVEDSDVLEAEEGGPIEDDISEPDEDT